MFIQGLPKLILFKVYSQTSLLSGLDNWKTVVLNLDCLHRGFTELKQSICLVQPNVTQMQTLATTPTLDTLVPMDIDQSRPRTETHTCYNCGDKGHFSCICPKPWKKWIQLTKLAERDIKSLVAKAFMAMMDMRDVAKRPKRPRRLSRPRNQERKKRIFRPVNGDTHSIFN